MPSPFRTCLKIIYNRTKCTLITGLNSVELICKGDHDICLGKGSKKLCSTDGGGGGGTPHPSNELI